ncbi:MAG TPA: hypothetical protein VFY71_12510 [Planctomycetota bacterium]|nr:hypothetical protein [Planctomycetota bacterium]
MSHEQKERLVKFCTVVGGQAVAHRYPNVWQREAADGTRRLLIGASSGQVDLVLALSHCLAEPFGLLYVLITPRRDHEPGRYQAPRPLNRSELEAFLHRFRASFEQDARHHVWIQSLTDETAQVVYDENDVIYAYGPLDEFERVLAERGLRSGSIDIPVPHNVMFHDAFDDDEDAIVAEWNWRWFPLEDQDDV